MLNATAKVKCSCGCGRYCPSPPYESNGKPYASAYCILSQSKSCSYCGGYYGEGELPKGHDYRCRCRFEALDN